MYTFSDLKTKAKRFLDEAGDTGTTHTLIGNLINDAQAALLMGDPWPFMLWDTEETITTVASQKDYTLHQSFGRPFYFWNRTTKQLMTEVPKRDLDPGGYDWTNATGSAQNFGLWSYSAVADQPSSAAVIGLSSTTTADNTSTYAWTFYGTNSSGISISESVNPGSTSSNSFSKIINITKAAASTGTITATCGGTTILSLLPSEYGRQYRQFQLLESPPANEVIAYRFWRTPRIMSGDNDIPDVPYPHSIILVYDALLAFSGYNEDVSPIAAQAWMNMRQRLYQTMLTTFHDGRSLGSRIRTVRPTLDELAAYPGRSLRQL